MALLRIGLVGCGRIAEKHVMALTKLREEAELTAICDISAERLEQFGRRIRHPHYPAVRQYSSVEEMLASDGIDLVTIATSSDSHAPLVRQALRAGKHVLVEKPLALTLDEAREIVREAEARHLTLAVSFQARYLPQIVAIKRAVTGNKFGTLAHGVVSMRWHRSEAYYAEASWREEWQRGGGLFMNQCIHYVDLLQWLMGPVASVYAQGGVYGQDIAVENMGAAVLRFHSGAVGIVEASNGTYPHSLGTSIGLFGNKGAVLLEGDRLNELKRWAFHEACSDTALPELDDRISHTPLYSDLVKAIRTGSHPLAAADSSIAAVEIVLAIYQSMATGKVIELPLGNFNMSDMAWME
ncbi:Gfo/Idh/MocA family oxidoreductase [Paenibacillus sp. J5C_2022]|uniref:Gfo/Idh/MocA family protein n=1 Tax=Paenibacillus sp. J5C2022 TaxID=2977129 RepID=UPI0021CEA1BE|nr:Gfo/Idh/MocA family oxidoreductase [Paenibacillus sp. J5C2022]MCU6710427.1 Gfo/Idh/MocA family oxidoreductase [Paenibacillus sp. J5C2022]